MYAVTVAAAGGIDVLGWDEVPDPLPGAGEVIVDVAASAVNRADLLQRQGFYPPPPGASDILGLECSGRIAALGAGVAGWRIGDEVCALLAGGGYAERVAVPTGQLMPVPPGVDLTTAAALPEAACTVWSNLVIVGRLSRGESVLVHGGASGIGTMATQVAAALGAAPVLCTVGSAAKADAVRGLGAGHIVDYNTQDFVEEARTSTGSGVDVILDIIGAKYLARNLEALAADGRLVVIGLQGGATAEVDLGRMMTNRLSVHATTLRARPSDQKAALPRRRRRPLAADRRRAGSPGRRRVVPDDRSGRRASARRGVRSRRQGAADSPVTGIPPLPEPRSVRPTSG